MRVVLTATAIAAIMTISSIAATAPTLPASAKKLTGTEITALYDGASVNWTNYKIDGTGTVKYDLKGGTQTGTWVMGGKKGAFTGKIRVNGDTFCYTSGGKTKEQCDAVYTDGADIYEVDPKGVVISKNQKQP